MNKWLYTGLLIPFTIFGMELPIHIKINCNPTQEITASQKVQNKKPQKHPKCFVRYLSFQLLNKECDESFEDVFIDIVSKQKNPKLYPELIGMRKFFLDEFRCQCE